MTNSKFGSLSGKRKEVVEESKFVDPKSIIAQRNSRHINDPCADLRPVSNADAERISRANRNEVALHPTIDTGRDGKSAKLNAATRRNVELFNPDGSGDLDEVIESGLFDPKGKDLKLQDGPGKVWDLGEICLRENEEGEPVFCHPVRVQIVPGAQVFEIIERDDYLRSTGRC